MLVSVSTPSLNTFLSELVKLKSKAAFLGLYHPHEEGEKPSSTAAVDEAALEGRKKNWAWVDGVQYVPNPFWAPGEPNDWCVAEDCAIMQPDEMGWADVACGTRQLCLCEAGGNDTSQLFRASQQNLTEQGFGDYRSCMKRRDPDFGIVACFWYRDIALQSVFVLLGVPSFFVMMYAGGCTACTWLGVRRAEKKFNIGLHDAVEPSPYGQLLDLPPGASFARVSTWIHKGAVGEVLYGGALLALAITELFHVQTRYKFSFAIDAIEALIMFFCKLQVAISTLVVSNYLSPYAKAVAGPWVTVLALSKAMMALSALALALVSCLVFDDEQYAANNKLCAAGYLFCWSLLGSLVFQAVAGFAIFRIQERAMGCVQDVAVFSRVVGCNWALLMGGTFGVGGALGFASALFVFDDPTDSINPFHGIGWSYVVAGVCQAVSGVALLLANQKMEAYFASSGGARDVELRAH